MEEKSYTFKEVAIELKASRGSVYRWRNDGKIHAVKVGQNWLVSQEELDRIKTQGL